MIKNSIPNNWTWSTLGDVCYPPQYGWTTSASNQGSLKFVRTTDITSGNINWDTVPYCKEVPGNISKYLLLDGDIVISRAGSVGFNYLFTNPQDAIFASYLIRFRPKINNKYVSYFLQSPNYWQAIYEEKLGIAIPNVNATKLKEISIPIPPDDEQEKIVSKIEELFSQMDAGVAGLKRVQELLKQYRASVLKAAFEGKLVPQDRNDEPAIEVLNKVGIKLNEFIDNTNVPNNWLLIRLGDIATTTSGGTPLRSHNEFYGGYIPWLKSGELEDELISSTDEFITDEGLLKSSAKVFPAGTVVVALYGATVGKTGIIDFDGATNQAVCGVFPLYNLIEKKYLFYWLQSKRQYLISISSGGAQPNISQGIIRNLIFPLAPINEQKRIISEIEYHLSIISRVENDIANNSNKANKLKQSILKYAFEGKLIYQTRNN